MKAIALTALALTPVLVACSSGKTTKNIAAAGATFPAPLYQTWFTDYSNKTGNRVTIKQLVAELVSANILLRLLILVLLMVL